MEIDYSLRILRGRSVNLTDDDVLDPLNVNETDIVWFIEPKYMADPLKFNEKPAFIFLKTKVPISVNFIYNDIHMTLKEWSIVHECDHMILYINQQELKRAFNLRQEK